MARRRLSAAAIGAHSVRRWPTATCRWLHCRRRERHTPEGAPPMQTVLYVSPMKLGHEVQVRQIHDRFPVTALARGVGIERLVAFIGSGFYALEITVTEGDFQEH